MAVAELVRFPDGAGAEQYDAVQAEIAMDGDAPEGLVVHSAGEVEGRFRVFNIWESADHARRFEEERLRPAMRAAMGEERYAQLPDADRPEVRLHNHVVP